jgi:hypothetical protein
MVMMNPVAARPAEKSRREPLEYRLVLAIAVGLDTQNLFYRNNSVLAGNGPDTLLTQGNENVSRQAGFGMMC